ncbi:MAG: DUF4176 domain-containing protein [Mollicutes bacterium]|nr:DUF4176 domain-containing protein [Mollicutes bacterium]
MNLVHVDYDDLNTLKGYLRDANNDISRTKAKFHTFYFKLRGYFEQHGLLETSTMKWMDNIKANYLDYYDEINKIENNYQNVGLKYKNAEIEGAKYASSSRSSGVSGPTNRIEGPLKEPDKEKPTVPDITITNVGPEEIILTGLGLSAAAPAAKPQPVGKYSEPLPPVTPQYSFETAPPQLVNTDESVSSIVGGGDVITPKANVVSSTIPGMSVGASNSGLTSINDLIASGSKGVENLTIGTAGAAIAGMGIGSATKDMLDTIEDIKDNFLPIGSIVKLKNIDKKVMVMGFCSISKEESGKVYDYSGCFYPEGYMAADKTCLFDNEDVEEVIAYGFKDEEEKSFKNKLNILINQIGTK